MNQKRSEKSFDDNYTRQPLVSTNRIRSESLSDSPPSHVPPPRRFRAKRDNLYHSMIEDTSLEDSDGSNIASTTTTNTGE
jgi:hypothetical protein